MTKSYIQLIPTVQTKHKFAILILDYGTLSGQKTEKILPAVPIVVYALLH